MGSDELHRSSVPSPAPPHLPYRRFSPTQRRPGGPGYGGCCLLRQLQQHVPPAEPPRCAKARWLRPRGLRVVSKSLPVAQRAERQLVRFIPARQQPVVHPALLRLAAAVHNKLTWIRRARPGLVVHRQPGGAAEVGPSTLLLLGAHRHGHPECAREEADPESDLPVRG